MAAPANNWRGTVDFVFWVADHFVQLRNLADGPRQSKNIGVQIASDADGALHDAGVGIDV